jgi:hypothetical protein
MIPVFYIIYIYIPLHSSSRRRPSCLDAVVWRRAARPTAHTDASGAATRAGRAGRLCVDRRRSGFTDGADAAVCKKASPDEPCTHSHCRRHSRCRCRRHGSAANGYRLRGGSVCVVRRRSHGRVWPCPRDVHLARHRRPVEAARPRSAHGPAAVGASSGGCSALYLFMYI